MIWEKKKYQARKHEFKEPKIAHRLVTVHKNEFLFRKKKKDKCCPFNYQHLSLGQDHQVYNIEDSFNIEDRWQLHSWDLLRLPQKKEKKKKTLKNPIILKDFENSPRTASLDTRKLDCLVCKANDKAFRNVQELFRTAMYKINLKSMLPCNPQWQHRMQQTFFLETKLCQKNF